ncbi:MAG TPA: ribonuclease D [Steroidobacteraceae bacterium]|nr:ribonuclease D [Steroidobacteraceae bacterium]
MIISSREDLEALAQRLADAPAIALDTEFLRERTYRAELCLLQIADAAGAWCVDPLALPDLSTLHAALGGPSIKVMHACRQDIEVLLPAAGFVTPVFDTQIAAALSGMPAQIGYAELVRRVTGRELSKAHTRTDWSRRPLSAEQIDYALDDVRYLLPIRAHLLAELTRLGRLAWLEEELAALQNPADYVVDPQAAWLRIRSFKALDADRSRLAQSLAAWRERRADERNRPRGWILDDAVLRDIVVRVPRTLEELTALQDMQPGFIKHNGAEVLELIVAARMPAALPRVHSRGAPDAHKTALFKKLSAVHQAVASEFNLPPEILATRRDLEQLADGAADPAIMSGWRREVIGQRLLAAL